MILAYFRVENRLTSIWNAVENVTNCILKLKKKSSTTSPSLRQKIIQLYSQRIGEELKLVGNGKVKDKS